MDVIQELRSEIIDIIKANATSQHNLDILDKVVLELPKDKSHGCLASNAAMVLAKGFKENPRNLAEKFKNLFCNNIQGIKTVDIAGPGFINFTMQKEFWQKALTDIYNSKDSFGKSTYGQKQKINVEFGSPNPTGPLHVGHTRGVIFGDVLANILKFVDFDVTRENYINDAGGQIDVLAKSLFIRYLEIAQQKTISIPEGLYPGDYLVPIAQRLYDEHGSVFVSQSEDQYLPLFKEKAIAEMMELIKAGFKKLNANHDIHVSEKSLHDAGQIEKVVEKLSQQNKTYIGTLPKPKGKEPEDWEPTEQLLFKAKEFGDDIDRALQKSDKNWTYFAADAAYHNDKLKRGFNHMVLVLGADHGGYIKRMKALIAALSNNQAEIDIKLCQLVKFIKNGETLKMSKRDGTFLTAEDVVEQVGTDSLRFIMLTRKNDMVLEFDLDKAIEQSKDNPIFYVQYAHARICSVLRQNTISITDINSTIMSKLSHESEIDLIRFLSTFPQTIESIAKSYEAHRLAFYLQELASRFHSYWNLGTNNPELKFITDDEETTQARIILLQTIKNVISIGLGLFSISPMEKM